MIGSHWLTRNADSLEVCRSPAGRSPETGRHWLGRSHQLDSYQILILLSGALLVAASSAQVGQFARRRCGVLQGSSRAGDGPCQRVLLASLPTLNLQTIEATGVGR